MSHLTRILIVLMTVGVVATGLGVASNAIWTDSDDVDNNAFTTGSVSLSTNPTTALVSFTTGAPGEDTTPQSLTVSNDGTMELRYAVTMTADNTDSKSLYAELDLTVREEGTNCATFDGTVLYGPDLPFLLSGNLIGDPTAGADTGDRTLAASNSEVLCFRVQLPDTAPNSVQAASTTAVFTFESEQTQNNP
jgi:spore coat-associated protein N